MTSDVKTDLRVVAIISAFNEADIIDEVIRELIAQRIDVYFIDDGSTDETVAIVQSLVGQGVISIERRMPEESAAAAARFEWGRILRRKAELATEIDADWFIHHDADEFRESPWPGVSLVDAIAYVDQVGFNAIDFECLNFCPRTQPKPSGTVRARSRTYTAPAFYDRLQIRCWKRTDAPVDLESSGGHEACFPGRNVFPIRFLLRHYPLRDREHAARKIFLERLPRYVSAERLHGWHIQYDDVSPDNPLAREGAAALFYDADRIRLQVMTRHRGVEELEAATAGSAAELSSLRDQLAIATEQRFAASEQLAEAEGAIVALQAELASRSSELEIAVARRAGLEVELSQMVEQVERHRSDCERLQAAMALGASENLALRNALDELGRRIHDLYQSRTWRWTAVLRAAYRLATRRE